MSTIDELIQQGIARAKAGNKAEAKKLFGQVVKQEPNNAKAWYFLSQVVDEKKQVLYCLRKVLELDSGNEKIKQRIRALEGETDLVELHVPKPNPKPIASTLDASPLKKTPYPLFVAVGVIFICFLLFLLFKPLSNGNNSNKNDKFRIGDFVQLYSSTGYSAVGVNRAAFDAYIDAAIADDTDALRQLLEDGRIILVKNGTKAKIIGTDYGIREVQFLDGDYAGYSGWLVIEELVRP